MQGKCKAITKDGKPCAATPITGRSWCYYHDPELEERRKESRRQGGEARSNAQRAAKRLRGIPPERLPEKLRMLIDSVEDESITPGQANAIVNLAKGSVSISESLTIIPLVEALQEEVARLKSEKGNGS